MDEIKIEFLDNGVLRITTGNVSMINHSNAEALIREIAMGLGGEVTKQARNKHGHVHVHGHDEQHQH